MEFTLQANNDNINVLLDIITPHYHNNMLIIRVMEHLYLWTR